MEIVEHEVADEFEHLIHEDGLMVRPRRLVR
jgi:hypothetical protein